MWISWNSIDIVRFPRLLVKLKVATLEYEGYWNFTVHIGALWTA